MRVLTAILLIMASAAFAEQGGGNRRGSGVASTLQWFIADGAGATIPTTANTYYGLPFAHMNTGFSTVGEWAGSVVAPSDGVLSDFSVALSGDIGDAGDDATFTLMRSAAPGTSAASDTAIACTISGGAGTENSCSDSAETLSVSAGDRLVMKVVIANTPSANVRPRWFFKMVPTTANDTWVTMNTLANSASSARYHSASGFFAGAISANEANTRVIWPTGGSITACRCVTDTDLSGTMTRTFNLFVNGAAQTDVQCPLSDTAQSISDTGSVSISAGDLFNVQDTPANSPTSSTRTACGFLFRPTNTGEFVLVAGYNSGFNTTANRYAYPGEGHESSPSASQATGAAAMPATLTMSAFYAHVTTAPATGASWLMTPFEAGSATAANCTIADTATQCNSTTDVVYESGNTFSIESDPSATAPAASGNASVSMVMVP